VDYKQEDAAGPGGEAIGAKSCMARSNVRLKPSHAEVDRRPSKRQSPKNAGENEVSSTGENAKNESMTMRWKDS
jgi:hypothetical protein